jgi:hypothetical protein
MLYKFAQTFVIFPQPLTWLLFLYEPNINVKKGILVFMMGTVVLLCSLGCSLLAAILYVLLAVEISIRVFIAA